MYTYAFYIGPYPANTRRWPNIELMLVHRLRRWTNISPTFDQRLVFAGSIGLHDMTSHLL